VTEHATADRRTPEAAATPAFNIETDIPDAATLRSVFEAHEPRLAALREIRKAYVTGTVPDAAGKPINIRPGAVNLEQGHLLFYLTRKLRPRITVETGFGFGMSASFILAAHKLNGSGAMHVSIDPHFRYWTEAVGLHTLERLGLADSFQLIEDASGRVLPRLSLPKPLKTLRLSFIDGNHLFDFALVDFFYLDRLTEPNGLIVIDDVVSPALRALLNFIAANRSDYRVVRPDARTAVCQKISKDERAWNHFRPFDAATGIDWEGAEKT
jgi:predicted O-methyltransferase YrrM